MNTARLIAATLATLIAASASATTRTSDDVSMTVDPGAPVRATLMPTVSIDASPATSDANPAMMRIADVAPLEVTLMPTVRITARTRPELAITELPTVRVTASPASVLEAVEIAEADDMPGLPVIDDESATDDEQPIGVRSRAMPR